MHAGRGAVLIAADTLRAALSDPNVRAFLAVIRAGEGTSDADGYRRMFGGELFDSMADHPRRAITKRLGGKPLTSTAAGAFQFLSRTWDECAAALALPDFGQASQDLAAAFLIKRRRGLEHAIAGRLEQAIAACAREWASLPGSPYGQPVRTLAQCRAVYEAAGGQYESAPAPATPSAEPELAQEGSMPLPAFLAAALPMIVEAIPALGKLFGSGSEVAERNVKAAELAVKLVTEATGSRNAQEAVEAMKADPAMVAVATRAVESSWHELTESGGGGIAGARKADAAAMDNGGPWWQVFRSPSFLFMLLAMPPVYAVIGSVVGIWGESWPSDVRASLATAIVSLVVGGGAGYYWGQTTSRNRTPSTAE